MNIEVLARYFILGCAGKGAGQVPLLPRPVVVVMMKAKSHKMKIDDGVLAYRLLNGAGLSGNDSKCFFKIRNFKGGSRREEGSRGKLCDM